MPSTAACARRAPGSRSRHLPLPGCSGLTATCPWRQRAWRFAQGERWAGVCGFVGQSSDERGALGLTQRGLCLRPPCPPPTPGHLLRSGVGSGVLKPEACMLSSRTGFERERLSPPQRRGLPRVCRWPRSAPSAVRKAEMGLCRGSSPASLCDLRASFTWRPDTCCYLRGIVQRVLFGVRLLSLSFTVARLICVGACSSSFSLVGLQHSVV